MSFKLFVWSHIIGLLSTGYAFMFYVLRFPFPHSTIYQKSTFYFLRVVHDAPLRFTDLKLAAAASPDRNLTVFGHDHALGCVTAGRGKRHFGFCCATTHAHKVRVRGEHVLAPLRHSKEPTGS